MAKTAEQKVLEKLARERFPVMYRAFLDGVYRSRANASIGQIIDFLRQGNIEMAVQSANLSTSAFINFSETTRTSYLQGTQDWTKWITNTANNKGVKGAFITYNIDDPKASDWLRVHSSENIKQIIEEQREATRLHLYKALEDGRNPRSAALELVGRVNPVTKRREGGVLGLTSQQVEWVNNMRGELETLDSSYFERKLRDKRFDSTIAKAIREGKEIPAEKINRIIRNYNNKVLQFRGEMIARTEMMSALSTSKFHSLEQAKDQGLLTGARKRWSTAGDSRVRDIHSQMNRVIVDLQQPFTMPNGDLMMHPHDGSLGASAVNIIHCRCQSFTEMEFI